MKGEVINAFSRKKRGESEIIVSCLPDAHEPCSPRGEAGEGRGGGAGRGQGGSREGWGEGGEAQISRAPLTISLLTKKLKRKERKE